MTTPKAYQIDKERRGVGTDQTLYTFNGVLADTLLSDVASWSQIRWPSAEFRDDPVRFFREILGVEPWEKQIEVIEAVRDNPRVSIASGHKVSKSHTAAGTGIWFYSSYEDARVIFSSTTARQVDDILWREVRMMHARSGRCFACKAKTEGQERLIRVHWSGKSYDEIAAVAGVTRWDAMAWHYGTERPDAEAMDRLVTAFDIPFDTWGATRDLELVPRPCPHSALIDGELMQMARSGLKSGFRTMTGFTAREAEAVAGISGKNLIYQVDEASGVVQLIFEAMEGNRAGGARMVLYGNPTKNEGEHFDSFYSKSDFYKSIRISSEDTPNAQSGRVIIPGLCERDFIEEKEREHGRESAWFQVRILGQHATHEEGKIFSLAQLAESQDRWHDIPAPEGRVFIGVDPAGASGTGDEICFAPRRGQKQLALITLRGLTPEGHLAHLKKLIIDLQQPNEKPAVVLDREGPVGYAVFTLLQAAQTDADAPFELVTVRASDKAQRQPTIYERVRDELAANLERWVRDGGALLEDDKLERELHCLTWENTLRGRLKLIDKRQIRKELGRSPDRYDATALSVWEPLNLGARKSLEAREPSPDVPKELDPYGNDTDISRGIIDPYG